MSDGRMGGSAGGLVVRFFGLSDGWMDLVVAGTLDFWVVGLTDGWVFGWLGCPMVVLDNDWGVSDDRIFR